MRTTSIEQQIEEKARELANEILGQRNAAAQILRSGRVFTPFDPAEDISDNQKEVVSSPMWSGGTATMTSFWTGSDMSTNQKRYYYEVYVTASSVYGAEPQFSVAYGHRLGSGSDTGGGQINDSPSRAIYSQYKQLLLQPGDDTFTFKDSVTSDSVYILNVNRARFKERMDAGNWQLSIAELNGRTFTGSNSSYTGSAVAVSASNKVFTYIDDSSESDDAIIIPSGRVYNIVSGSITDGAYSANTTGMGLFYPDMGVLVMNAAVLNQSHSFNTVTGSNVNGDNAYKLFTAISGAASISSTNYAFEARSTETVASTHYFIRVKNAEYNFSNNPSFATGSTGDFRQLTFVNDPKVYVTTIGLYNERYELLAVAKTSKPVLKSFDREMTIKVKLDY